MTTESQYEELFIPLDKVEAELRDVHVLVIQREIVLSNLRAAGVVRSLEGGFIKPGEGSDAAASELRVVVARLNQQNEVLLQERNQLAEENEALRGQRWREYLKFNAPSDEVNADILDAMESILRDPDASLAEEFKRYIAELLAKEVIEPVPDMSFGVGLVQFTTEVTEKVVDLVIDRSGNDTPEGQKLRLQIIESIQEGFLTGDINDSFVYELLQNLGVRVLSEDILKEFFRLRTLSLNPTEEQELKKAILYGFTRWKKDRSTSLQPEMDLTS